ncbi:MAG: hypothetical protein LBJ14_00165 [Desulfarculales bacterium]|jgi:hypothetical protein|nr:hypothetical protein [Desulfarculales bacterium]
MSGPDRLAAVKAVILYPALGSPALVEDGGSLDVIILAHHDPELKDKNKDKIPCW